MDTHAIEALEARHLEEERQEAARSLAEHPRPLRVQVPAEGHLPRSSAWLERLYRGAGAVRGERKPPVFDHLRSHGPLLVSVDEVPLAVLDGMSQTATVPAGFAPDEVVRAYVEGRFGQSLLHADGGSEAAREACKERYAEALRALVPGLPHVAFVHSGAEATEKAFALAMANAPGERARRLLAFEGSFHGRTLLSLHASHNPAKRTPFEFPGHEVTFVSYPVWPTPSSQQPEEPQGWREALWRLDWSALSERAADPLARAEVEALRAVSERLASGAYFAVVVEPMQSEGGDRYATARFHRALRLLTRRHGVALIVDEVQTGFGLLGPFAWHRSFAYVDAEGRPDAPDAVCFAKRAQLGVVLSRWPDPEPAPVHVASLVRGLEHLRIAADEGREAIRVERLVAPRLVALGERFASLASHPRGRGYAFAFELPDGAHLKAYLAQRFGRGAVVFGAGSRTVRYRLNRAYDEGSIERLFVAIESSLRWLEQHGPQEAPPAWPSVAAAAADAPAERISRVEGAAVQVREASPAEASWLLPAITALEEEVYEPARRDPHEKLAMAFEEGGVAIVAEEPDGEGGRRLVGYALGAPLERFAEVGGPDRDPFLGRGNTLYAMALTVAPSHQGRGLGRRLKEAMLRAAEACRCADGARRYRHCSGRNRVGAAEAMWRLNRSLGAYEVTRVRGAYEDDEASEARYYRMPLGPFRVEPSCAPGSAKGPAEEELLDVAGGVERPLREAPESLRLLQEAGGLYGPAVQKLTLTNYATPAVVRAMEYLAALAPEQPHLLLANDRDEAFEKVVRALRWNRPRGVHVFGLRGGYVGHTTAAARSLSDPAVHEGGEGYFSDWPRLPHPEEAGVEAALAAVREAIERFGGAERVLGLFVEPLQERTGRLLPVGYLQGLAVLREETGLPVIFVESAAAMRRAGGPFFAEAGPLEPDARLWWAGGQVAFLHLSDALFVDKPLTLVSTWDGDELSLVRVQHAVRTVRRLSLAQGAAALEGALEPIRAAGFAVRGSGLLRVVQAGEAALRLQEALRRRGVCVARWAGGRLGFCPPLDLPAAAYERLARAVAEVFR